MTFCPCAAPLARRLLPGRHVAAPIRALGATLLALALTLAGCGGGGGSDSAGGSTASSSSSADTRVTVQLSGVAAFGSPLTGARLQAIDMAGTVLGSTTTSRADGRYSLTLQPASGAIVVQVTGLDAAGLPLVLHSAIASPAAGSATLNIHPLTDAALALALGAEPRQIVSDAAASGSAGTSARAKLTAALPQLAAAATFLKTVVKQNLADAKTADSTKLDLFGDASFSADKTGLDLALEALAVGYGGSSAQPTLLLGNKIGLSPIEVVVDLATAANELAKPAGNPTAAITSSLKSPTSSAAVVAYLAKVDTLATTVNAVLANAVANGNTALVSSGLTAAGIVAGYEKHDGTDAAALVSTLTGYATSNLQLGRPQVTGCLDEALDKSGCKRIGVAVRVMDPNGSTVGRFMNAVTYDSKATPSARWNFVGNGLPAALQVRSAAWQPLAADQTALGSGPAPVLTGVQVHVGSGLGSATLQAPGGHVLPLLSCSRAALCLGLSADAGVMAIGHGGLAEDTVFNGISAWLGTADTTAGARYKASFTASSATSTVSVPLPSVHAGAPASARFPTLDEFSATTPLTASALQAALSVNWVKWAAAQPDLRVVQLRVVHADAAGAVVITDHTPATLTSTGIELSPATLPSGFTIARSTLWIAAMDRAGRWYHTSIAAR